MVLTAPWFSPDSASLCRQTYSSVVLGTGALREHRAVPRLDDSPLRDDLRGQVPYGAPQAPLPIALNVNENTHPLPEAVAQDIVVRVAAATHTLTRYPDRQFTQLREAFARYLGQGLTAQNIWAANGYNEVLQDALQEYD